MVVPEEGGFIPPSKRADGSYHIDGELVLITKDLQYAFFKQLIKELEGFENNNIVFLAPLP
jgi:hypothetical protein